MLYSVECWDHMEDAWYTCGEGMDERTAREHFTKLSSSYIYTGRKLRLIAVVDMRI